jgi:hypothetical protein
MMEGEPASFSGVANAFDARLAGAPPDRSIREDRVRIAGLFLLVIGTAITVVMWWLLHAANLA